MTLGSIGKVLATQALETTKNTVKNSVMDAVLPPDPPKSAPATPAAHASDIGSAIVGQIQAMQRPLKEDQELAVSVRACDETLRVTEIFVPNPEVLVFAGMDSQGNITRLIAPSSTAQVVCRILRVSHGATASRVNVLTPRPQPKPTA